MIVKAIWEFDVDTEGLIPEFIDIPGLAKDLAKRELESLLSSSSITADDFDYLVEQRGKPFYIFTSKQEAAQALERMRYLAYYYGFVSMVDFKNLVGQETVMDDLDNGWFVEAFKDAEVVSTPDGWSINIPKPSSIV